MLRESPTIDLELIEPADARKTFAHDMQAPAVTDQRHPDAIFDLADDPAQKALSC